MGPNNFISHDDAINKGKTLPRSRAVERNFVPHKKARLRMNRGSPSPTPRRSRQGNGMGNITIPRVALRADSHDGESRQHFIPTNVVGDSVTPNEARHTPMGDQINRGDSTAMHSKLHGTAALGISDEPPNPHATTLDDGWREFLDITSRFATPDLPNNVKDESSPKIRSPRLPQTPSIIQTATPDSSSPLSSPRQTRILMSYTTPRPQTPIAFPKMPTPAATHQRLHHLHSTAI
jgi:hypothetical protein